MYTHRSRFCATAVLVALSFTALPALSQTAPGPRKLDDALAAASRSRDTQRVLVRTRPEMRDQVRRAVEARGRRVARDLGAGALLQAELDGPDLAALAARPDVEGLSLDAVVDAAGQKRKTSSTKTASTSETTSNLSAFSEWWTSAGQDLVLRGTLGLGWAAPTGAGVGVAVIDSGLDGTAPGLSGRISAFYDFTSGGRKSTPTDAYGHGSHVAGLIGAAAASFRGIAPGVHFVGLKVLDGQGQGRTSDVIAALDFVVANRRRLGVDVVNLSLGHPILEPAATDPLVQAVERAVAAGLVVVASAGNLGQHPTTGVVGYAGITSPGNAPSAITAGSFDMHGTADRRDDTVSAFSSRGPTWFDALAKPDLVAPGHGLFAVNAGDSTLSRLSTQSTGGTAIKMFGTSMAAATTTGVVALVIETTRTAFPTAGRALPPSAIKAVLQYTSIAVGARSADTEADLLTGGAGALNAAGALRLAATLDPAAATGSWWLTSPVDEVSSFSFVPLPWTQRIIWGDRLLLGHAVYTNAAAWQTSVVWGDALIWGEALDGNSALLQGDTFIWGENVVTSTALIWGDAIVWGDGLVTVDGQTFIWGDTFIWGEALIWGDTVTPGPVP